MLFSGENKKSQIVPVLPAASREAGRMVTSSESNQKKSGLISAVRPAVPGNVSGTRPAVGGNVSGTRPAISGMRAAVSPAIAGAPTQIMPAVELPGARARDGRSVAIWVLSSLLILNMGATVLLLANMDRPNPELIEQKIRTELAVEEMNKLKTDTEKFMKEHEGRTRVFQEELENARGQWQLIDERARESARATEQAPVYGADGNVTTKGAPK